MSGAGFYNCQTLTQWPVIASYHWETYRWSRLSLWPFASAAINQNLLLLEVLTQFEDLAVLPSLKLIKPFLYDCFRSLWSNRYHHTLSWVMWFRLCLFSLPFRLFLTSSIVSGDGFTLLSFNSATIVTGRLCRFAYRQAIDRSLRSLTRGFNSGT